MKQVLLVPLLAVLVFGSVASAHDGTFNVDFDKFEAQTFVHEDDSPFKGQVLVNVTNNSADPWGGFHFFLFGVAPPLGSPIEDVYFGWTGYVPPPPGVPMPDPISTLPSYSFDVDNVDKTLEYYFQANPVNPGQSATFIFHTDNTIAQGFFGLGMYPLPVPEPMTVSLLAVGALALIRRRR